MSVVLIIALILLAIIIPQIVIAGFAMSVIDKTLRVKEMFPAQFGLDYVEVVDGTDT